MAHIVRERKIYTRCVYLKLVSFNETRTHAENGGKRGREKKTNIIQYNPNDNNSNRSLQSCAVNCRRRWRRQRRGAAKTRDAFIYLSYIVFVFNQNTDRHQQKKQRTEKKDGMNRVVRAATAGPPAHIESGDKMKKSLHVVCSANN